MGDVQPIRSNVVAFPRKFNESGGQWDPWLTKRQAATLCGRTTRWVVLMHKEGIPTQLRNGRRVYPHDELRRWFDDREKAIAERRRAS